jgi:plastocyanin
MKKALSVAAATVALLALIGCAGGPPVQTKVSISDSDFSPTEVSVTVGGTVEWTNDGTTLHTVTTADSDSRAIPQDATYARSFEEAGTYDYFCRYHPSETGRVRVR